MYERNNKFSWRMYIKYDKNKTVRNQSEPIVCDSVQFHYTIPTDFRIECWHWRVWIATTNQNKNNNYSIFPNVIVFFWPFEPHKLWLFRVTAPFHKHKHGCRQLLFRSFFIYIDWKYLFLDIHFREHLWQSKEWINGSGEKKTTAHFIRFSLLNSNCYVCAAHVERCHERCPLFCFFSLQHLGQNAHCVVYMGDHDSLSEPQCQTLRHIYRKYLHPIHFRTGYVFSSL